MVAVVASGGGAAAAVPLIGKAATVQLAAATTASEAALSVALAAEAVGSCAAAEVALGAAVAAESAATAAAGIAAANVWNPAGWAIGAVLVGASEHSSHAVTWGCYKPIIGEVDTEEKVIKPISFADLAAHPEVRLAVVSASPTSANLPNVEIENQTGQRFLLRGVLLPWGTAAYHAEKIDEHIDVSLHTTVDRMILDVYKD